MIRIWRSVFIEKTGIMTGTIRNNDMKNEKITTGSHSDGTFSDASAFSASHVTAGVSAVSVRVKKLKASAVIPTYGTDHSAGADLYSAEDSDTVIAPGSTVPIHTGIVLEIPDGLCGLIYARSGLAAKQDLAPANMVGVIDSDYRGEIIVALRNYGREVRTVKQGERVAQIVFSPYYKGLFELTDGLSDTQRGSGGFGSTGR